MTKETEVKKPEDKVEIKRPQNIYESIEHMTHLLSKEGISKDNVVSTGGNNTYKSRGIDDIRNNTSSRMKECALNIIPSVISRTEKERPTKSGGISVFCILEVSFKLVNTIDKSFEIAVAIGEAADSGDKATNKAMSVAYKNMAINLFNIPTEGEEDTDGESVVIKATKRGVFESDIERNTFQTSVTGLFQNAETLAQLNNVESFHHEKLILMRNSEVPEDKAVAESLRYVFSEMHEKLKEKAKPLKGL